MNLYTIIAMYNCAHVLTECCRRLEENRDSLSNGLPALSELRTMRNATSVPFVCRTMLNATYKALFCSLRLA